MEMYYPELRMAQAELLLRKIGGMEGMEKILSNELIITHPANLDVERRPEVLASLLELEGDPIEVPTVDCFHVGSNFRMNDDGEVPIFRRNDKFNIHLLHKVEEKVKKKALKQQRLTQRLLNAPILDALGGRDKAEVKLAHVFEFLRKTANWRCGYLFHVTDADDQLWSLFAGTKGTSRKWNLYANSIREYVENGPGTIVVSPADS